MIKYFRQYEKYIFWGIVAVILPAFPISGVMLSTCSQRSRPPAGELFGEPVQAEDFQIASERLAKFSRVLGRESFSDRDTWNHLTMLHEADRAGVEVADEELALRVEKLYRQILSYQKAYEVAREKYANMLQNQGLMQQLLPYLAQEAYKDTVFDYEGYRKLLERPDIGLLPTEFEKTFREVLRGEKLRGEVGEAAKPDPVKLYEAYQAKKHKRKAVYVPFAAADFPLPSSPTAAELQAHYDKDPERYREPRKYVIEWVGMPAAAFEAQAGQPSDAEIQARYDANRPRYRIDAPLPASPTALGATPTAVVESYRPLAEVKAEIVAELRADKKLELALKRVEELRAKAVTEMQAGRPVTLAALAKEAGAEHGDVGPCEELDLMRPEIKAWPLFGAVNGLGQSGPGSISETLRHDEKTRAFFVRLVERRQSRIPSMSEVEARVRESFLVGLEDELKAFHAKNAKRYKQPAQASIETAFVSYARLERQVPPGVTGTARAEELKKKAITRLDEVRTTAGEKGSDGKPKDLDTVCLDKGAEHAKVKVEKSGKDLAADVKATELITRLQAETDVVGELSAAIENDAKTGVFLYVVRQRFPEKDLTFAEAKDRVKKDLAEDRAYERAKAAADAFAKAAQVKPAELRALAAKAGRQVRETGFLAREDKIEGDADAHVVPGTLFGMADLGSVSPAVEDDDHKTSYVIRFVAKEPAPLAGFEEAKKDLAKGVLATARREATDGWSSRLQLEARGIDEAYLREAYDLRHGPDGLASLEAAQVFVAIDAETIRTALEAKARADAVATLAEIRNGARFDDLARKRSQDLTTKKRGGSLGAWRRGQGPRELQGNPQLEATLFALKDGEVSEPVRSSVGWHLLQGGPRRSPEEATGRHILFRTERGRDEEGNLLALDPEIERQAMAKSLEKAQKVEARLRAGEDFLAVAEEVSDTLDGERLAMKRGYQWETEFERAALAAPIGEPTAILTAGPDLWEVLLVEEHSFRDRRETGAPKARDVRRVLAKGDRGKRALERLKEDLAATLASLEKEMQGRQGMGRGYVLSEYRKAFEDFARGYSEAPSGSRGGRVGVLAADPLLPLCGPAVRDAMYACKDGETSAVVKGKSGYHIVRVFSRTKRTFDEARTETAEVLVEGLDF